MLGEHSIIAVVAGHQVETSAPFVRPIIPSLLYKYDDLYYETKMDQFYAGREKMLLQLVLKLSIF